MAAPSTFGVPARLVHRAVIAHLRRAHVRVGSQIGALTILHFGKPRRLPHPRPDGRRRLPAALVTQLLERDARDFDVAGNDTVCNVDPVEQRAGEPLLIAADG
jgi:hypothetical protein